MQDITPNNIDMLVSLIGRAEHITIVSHMKPDGDALGSCLGMYHFLGLCGKQDRKVVLPHRTPYYLNFLIGKEVAGDILFHEDKAAAAEDAIRRSDLIICLDFNAHGSYFLCVL